MLGSAHSPGARGDAGATGGGTDATGSGMGSGSSTSGPRRRSSSVLVGRRVVGLRVEGNGGARGGLHRSVGAEIGGDHERLARPQRGERAPDVLGGRGERPSRRGQRHAGRHQDGHEDHRDQEHGGAGRPEAAVQRTADGRAEVPAGVLERSRVREGRRSLGQLGQAADAEHAEHRADGQAPGVGPLVLLVLVLVEPGPIEQQGQTGAEGHERQQDAHPAGHEAEAGVDAVADGTELLAPEGQRQEDAERDQPDGPQVAGLAPPERRPRRRCRRPLGPARRLLGGTGGGARRGAPAGLGHHSAVEITG